MWTKLFPYFTLVVIGHVSSDCEFNGIKYKDEEMAEGTCVLLICKKGSWEHTGQTDEECIICALHDYGHVINLEQRYFNFNAVRNYPIALSADFGVSGYFKGSELESRLHTMNYRDDPNTFLTVMWKTINLVTINGYPFEVDDVVRSVKPCKTAVLAWREGRCIHIVGTRGIAMKFCGRSLYIWVQPSVANALDGLCSPNHPFGIGPPFTKIEVSVAAVNAWIDGLTSTTTTSTTIVTEGIAPTTTTTTTPTTTTHPTPTTTTPPTTTTTTPTTTTHLTTTTTLVTEGTTSTPPTTTPYPTTAPPTTTYPTTTTIEGTTTTTTYVTTTAPPTTTYPTTTTIEGTTITTTYVTTTAPPTTTYPTTTTIEGTTPPPTTTPYPTTYPPTTTPFTTTTTIEGTTPPPTNTPYPTTYPPTTTPFTTTTTIEGTTPPPTTTPYPPTTMIITTEGTTTTTTLVTEGTIPPTPMTTPYMITTATEGITTPPLTTTPYPPTTMAITTEGTTPYPPTTTPFTMTTVPFRSKRDASSLRCNATEEALLVSECEDLLESVSFEGKTMREELIQIYVEFCVEDLCLMREVGASADDIRKWKETLVVIMQTSTQVFVQAIPVKPETVAAPLSRNINIEIEMDQELDL